MAAHLVLVSFLFAFCGAQVLLSGNIITDVYVVTAYGTPSFDPSVLAQWYNFPLPFLNMLGTFTNCLPSIRQGAVLTITGGQLSGGVISELDFKTFVASLPSTANIPVFVLDVGITSFLDAVADFCGHHGNSGTRPYVVLSPFGQCGQGAVAQGVPLSFILQHEIAEMIANPFLTNGQAFEIGDTCALYSAFCPPQSIPQWIALTSPLTGSICYCDATVRSSASHNLIIILRSPSSSFFFFV